MRNYVLFHIKIDVSTVILVIKDLTCLVSNSSKSSMRNYIFDFNVLKNFGINTRSGKVLSPLHVQWKIPSSGWVKINIDGAAKGFSSLVTCGGIFCGNMEEFISGFFAFLDVQTALVVEFYGIIHVIEQAQKMVLLVYDLNVILPWFVLHLLLWLMFIGCFVICGILVLITVWKSSLGFRVFHIFREGNACPDKLAIIQRVFLLV